MATLDPLISKLICLLEGEVFLIASVRDELREILLELNTITSFLKDADSATSQTELQATWVSQVRDSAFEIQDIIDEFEYHKNKRRALGKYRSFVYKSVHFPQDLWLKRHLASKLQKLKSAIDAISKRRQRYEVDRPIETVPSTDPHSWLRFHHESALFLKEDEVVGFQNAKKKIGGWLLSEEMERIVISVWGLGGSGKTTLMANVYNNPKIKRHFDCYAWVTVSQTYEIRDILAAIVKDFSKSRNERVPGADVGSMDYRSLVDLIVNYLENKRYVIVLDDVWDLGLWNQLRIALPNNTHGSRVMISTRSKDIACYSYGVNSYVRHNGPLEEDEAFRLFCRKAFSNNPCPNNLKQIASNLVNKCEGLPLALVTLGGAMSSKSESEWTMVDSSLTWQLSNNPDLQKMKTILLLSYHTLPHRLKLCFLYCSVFPEDHLMYGEKLTRLWLAEGFLEEVGGLTPEQVAESYLMELVRRSLLQVVGLDGFDLLRNYYKMHDILREFAISISIGEKFCSVCKDKEAVEGNNCRILSIQENIDLQNEPRLRKRLSQVRSFFLFITNQVSSKPIKLPYGFQLLRVLDLEDLNIDKISDDIVNCFNLRCLNLANTGVRELPKLIGNLTQLRTLNLWNTNVQVLPVGITKLHHLRHLLAKRKGNIYCSSFTDAFGAVQVAPHIERLVNLQVLTNIRVDVDLVGKLGNLTNLRRFCPEGVTEEMEKEMCLAINKMEHLDSLEIITADENVVLHLESLSSTAPRLKFFSIRGKLDKVNWFHCLNCLNWLVLCWTRFEDDILPYIDSLPNLTVLDLYNACVGERLYFGKGFPKLGRLIISYFPQLKQITVEEGVMPNIEELRIVDCVELETTCINYLASLQTICLKDVSSEIVSQIHEGFTEFEHQPKIILI